MHLYIRKQRPYIKTIYSADYDAEPVKKQLKDIVCLENSLQFSILKSCQCSVSEGTCDWRVCLGDTALQNYQFQGQ
jgi:hypothetical protein